MEPNSPFLKYGMFIACFCSFKTNIRSLLKIKKKESKQVSRTTIEPQREVVVVFFFLAHIKVIGQNWASFGNSVWERSVTSFNHYFTT